MTHPSIAPSRCSVDSSIIIRRRRRRRRFRILVHQSIDRPSFHRQSSLIHPSSSFVVVDSSFVDRSIDRPSFHRESSGIHPTSSVVVVNSSSINRLSTFIVNHWSFIINHAPPLS
jgi:hypothetical protein